MTRPKVEPDKRIRTAQACDSCKKRKQKCNGLSPCKTCEKRRISCNYSCAAEHQRPPSEGPLLKKTRLPQVEVNELESDTQETVGHTAPFGGDPEGHAFPQSRCQEGLTFSDTRRFEEPTSEQSEFGTGGQNGFLGVQTQVPSVEHVPASSNQLLPPGVTEESTTTLMSRATIREGQDEEAVVYGQSRMLQDATGRLLYFGDSATLSFLQLIRMMVENTVGPSPFTTDPRRHRILESQMSLPIGFRHTHLLPEKRTARVLVEAFFINTHGLMLVFDKQLFFKDLEICYSDPLDTDPSWLCLLNLVFAIGLMLATPPVGSEDAAIIEKLRNDSVDRAEVFYLNAKSLADPSAGFEDAGFWSIQALFLMAVYMLTKSKRNSAWAFFGMAVRSAFAQGLHREETMVIFTPEDQRARRNLWRSLYIMDRYLACSLGRPTAISDDDCSGDTLSQPEASSLPNANTLDQISAQGLEASVRNCFVIGMILKRVYQQRRISTRVAQEIADVCKTWPKTLAPSLHWRQATAASASQRMAILHVNMFYCHSIILLARPFFLFVMNVEAQRASSGENDARPRTKHIRMGKFAEACLIASSHTIVLAQNAFEAGYLPRRNPAVIYFLLAAALIVLSNDFASLYANNNADKLMASSIKIMAYCAETDPQARRLLYILETFKAVVDQQRIRRMQQQQEQYASTAPDEDPQASIFLGNGGQQPTVPPAYLPPVPQQAAPLRQASTAFTDNSISLAVPPISVPFEYSTADADPPISAMERRMTNAGAPSMSNFTQSPARSEAPPGRDHSDTISLARQDSLSDLLNLGSFDIANPDTAESDESWALDDQIDFDTLWAWPASATPALKPPDFMGDVQGIGGSTVPMFGMTGT